MKFAANLLLYSCLFGWASSLGACANPAEPVYQSSPALTTTTLADRRQVVANSLKELELMQKSKRNFEASDARWLVPLNQVLGAQELEIPDLNNLPGTRLVNCELDWQKLAQEPNAVNVLTNTLKTMQAASSMPCSVFIGPDYKLRVYNRTVCEQMKPSYSSQDVLKMRDMLAANGVFRIKINPDNGLVCTSDIPTDENQEMAARQWVTDTVWAGYLEREKDPAAWQKALETLCAFYTNSQEQAAFDKAIADPESYRQGGPVEGVAHIFYPNTLKRDSEWFNNKRLESHGMALYALTDSLRSNLLGQAPSSSPSPQYLQTIVSLTAYLAAIDYPTAPSAGNWEETPFPGGLTWDTQIINDAMLNVVDLMTNPDYSDNPGIQKLRNDLQAQKHGAFLADTQKLQELIKRGQERVRNTYYAESPGHREKDISLSLLSSRPTAQLDDDPLISVQKHLENLQMLEKSLVRGYGALRYAPFKLKLNDGQEVESPDSYLNLNYNIACDKDGQLNLEWGKILSEFGSKDASDPLIFAARSSLSTPHCEAQWFLVSDVCRGYCEQGCQVYQEALKRTPANQPIRFTPQERKLLDCALAGAARCFNRSCARITPEQETTKANGSPAPAWSVPEAWQCVSTLIPHVNSYLPGVNTPLTWAEASLWNASNKYIEFLRLMETVEK